LLTFWKGSVGVAPGDKGWLVGTGALLQKLQAASAVKKPALGERAASSMGAKGGKVVSGEPSAIEDNQRMHVAVGRVVVMDCRNELHGLSVVLFEFEHRRTG